MPGNVLSTGDIVLKKDKDLCPYGKETQQTIKYLSKIYGISDGDNC